MKSVSRVSAALQAVARDTAPGASEADVRMRVSRVPGLSPICLGRRPLWLAFSGSRGSPSPWEWHCLGRQRGLALADTKGNAFPRPVS